MEKAKEKDEKRRKAREDIKRSGGEVLVLGDVSSGNP